MEVIQKYVFRKKMKDIDVFNSITNKKEAKTMTKHISCDWKCKFNIQTCNSNQKQNNKIRQCKCKNYRTYKKNYSWNPNTCVYENGKHLKSILDTSEIACDEITSVMDIVPTKMTNTIATICQ